MKAFKFLTTLLALHLCIYLCFSHRSDIMKCIAGWLGPMGGVQWGLT